MPLVDDDETISISGIITAHSLAQKRQDIAVSPTKRVQTVTHCITITIETADSTAVRKLFGTRFQQKHAHRADLLVWPKSV